MHPVLRFPYALAGAAADTLARLPLRGEGKLARALRARRGALAHLTDWAASHRDPARPLLWIHAPSVGEGLMAKPVLDSLRGRHPEWQVCYTYFSPSAERFAAGLDVDVRGYLPFDRSAHAARLLDALRPRALVFSKLDVWPLLTECAARRGVRVGVISAAMSETSGRSGAIARALTGDAYRVLDAVGAVDRDDADRLAAAGVPAARLSVTGDTRYDQVVARAAARDPDAPVMARLRAQRPTVVAGSTWPADEAVLLPAWRAIRSDVPDARLIVAPHEPTAEHLEPVRAWALAEGLRVSTLDGAQAADDVVLVDRVGVLGDLYAIADAAYVGGGFHAAGLHSVLEPASFGVPVVFGPRYHGSRDAKLLHAARGGEPAADVPGLARALRILLTESDTRRRAGAAALDTVRAGLGAAARSVELVERLMEGGG